MSAEPKVHLDRDGRARCGHPRAGLFAVVESAATCGRCLDIAAGVSYGGIQPLDMKPHGTRARYRRHLRDEGKPVRCEPCLQAERRRNRNDKERNNALRRERYAAARAAGLSARQASQRKDLRRAA